MAERYYTHTFPSGLTLIAEQMAGVHSAAMTIMLPAGAASDPADRSGAATVLGDLVLRGAGSRGPRELTEHLDSLGLQRSSSVGIHHSRFSCAALASRVVEGFATYADIILRPHLPADGFESARDLSLQALAGVDDDPRHKLSIKLREWHLPAPYGRNGMGVKEDLEKLTAEFCRADHSARYRAQGAIIAIAGDINFDEVKAQVEQHFGGWSGQAPSTVTLTPPPGPYHFEKQESEQTYIGMAYGSIPETDPDYYVVRLAMEALGGGMSGRLFTEIREKRGLCYSVSAGYSSLKGMGNIFASAGTSNDRAQATLDCLVAEIHRLSDGIQQDELDRAKIGLKASTIMSAESSGQRAGSIAHDWFMRGRLRSIDEIKATIESVTLDRVNDYLSKNKPGRFTTVIVGPKELVVPE